MNIECRGLSAEVRRDLEAFAPNIVHISSPDFSAHRAVTWARKRNIATVASVHTRFETYLSYYHLEFMEPALRALLRRLYRRCDAVLAPAESTAAVLRAQRMSRDIFIWTRGVDREQFNPERRDMGWRRGLGIGDEELAVAFLGRLVLEKGSRISPRRSTSSSAAASPITRWIIGEGPAGHGSRNACRGLFVGHQVGGDLARALASGDVFLNPSVTETFGNVTLESMACALPVVAAEATGATSLVVDGKNGILCEPGDIDAYADALERYAKNPKLRERHGKAGLAFARTQAWDAINDASRRLLARDHKRERLARMARR